MFKVGFGKSIRKQLLNSFSFIVFLMIMIGFTSIYHIRRVYKTGNEIYVNNIQTIDYLQSLKNNLLRIERCTVDVLERFDNIPVEDNRNQIKDFMDKNNQLMINYEILEFTKGEKEVYDKCKLNIVEFNKCVLNITELVDEERIDEAQKLYIEKLVPIENETYKLLDEVTELATKNAEKNDNDNYNSYQRVILAILVTLALTTVLAAMLSFRVSNTYTQKLGDIQKWAKRISEYNVSEDINELGSDEFGTTAKALNDSQFMIRDLVEKIMEESTMISDTGKEVSDAIRKSKKRMEDMNLEVSNLSITENEYIDEVVDMMLDESTSPEFIEKIRKFLDIIEKNSAEHEELCKELTRLATYMEQIAITSDYQNEMAKTHREQVGKFKINSED